MKVRTLEIENFRGIRNMTLNFHDRINVLVGENGAGKSSVLDTLSILMFQYVRAMLRLKPRKGNYGEFDINNESTYYTLNIKL